MSGPVALKNELRRMVFSTGPPQNPRSRKPIQSSAFRRTTSDGLSSPEGQIPVRDLMARSTIGETKSSFAERAKRTYILRETEERCKQAKAQNQRLTAEIEDAQKINRLSKQSILNLKGENEVLQDANDELGAKCQEAECDIAELVQYKKSSKESYSQLEEKYEIMEERTTALEEELEQKSREQKDQLAELTTKRNELEAKINQLEAQTAVLKEGKTRSDARQEVLEELVKEYRADVRASCLRQAKISQARGERLISIDAKLAVKGGPRGPLECNRDGGGSDKQASLG
ncbi:unnamed protein product [Zymoseptoria tritici ST99CH_1E4]|uniref:Uncharacterized protein n=1 Tax=Zymoseptoria tritici ST99CH_1E4 TaxID=1276532 RepID=A0A2H1G6L3_ZYMTR|nr:unnamed protein product [Zymoseptoria tritici ST99CH_1E4]